MKPATMDPDFISDQNQAPGGLPQDLLDVLPSNPFEQLDLSRRIADLAWRNRITSSGNSVPLYTGGDAASRNLQQRVTELEASLTALSLKLSHSKEEQEALAGENTALSGTVKRLNRQVATLESLKRTLLQQLKSEPDMGFDDVRDGESPFSSTEKFSHVDSWVQSAANPRPPTGKPEKHEESSIVEENINTNVEGRVQGERRTRNNRSSQINTPSFSNMFTPVNKGRKSGPVTPSKDAARNDSRHFFTVAKSRVSSDVYMKLIDNVKGLNGHLQSKEETLKKVQELLGKPHLDLYAAFEHLITQHGGKV